METTHIQIRSAERADCDRIRTIAHDSFRASYSLSPQGIETLLQGVFGDEALVARFNDPAASLLVAETSLPDSDDVVGFIDVMTDRDHTIRWLHVDPEARGEGLGTALIEHVRENAHESGAPLSAHVLEAAVEGKEFLERFGLERSGNDQLEFGTEEFSVAVFTEGEGTEDANEPAVEVPDSVSVEGTTRPLDREERLSGTDAPFFPIYTEDGDERFGYFCSQCGSADIMADGLDRLECGNCGNIHRADEWDEAYL